MAENASGMAVEELIVEVGSVEPKGKIGGNGKGKGMGMENVASLPFIDANVQTLRTRGLRENIKR